MTKLEQMLFDNRHSGYYNQTLEISCQSHNEYIAQLMDHNGGRVIASAEGNTIVAAVEALQELLTVKEQTT